jgi:phosphatidylserine/phosphatidylglycerophosphate/cardiolipin synthase-like enzyme
MTDRLDLGAYRYEEGFFLVREDAEPAEYVPGTSETGRYRHVFSYRGSRTSIKEAVLDLIASAQRKVFVASFRIGDTDLLDALYEAAERLRGGVYVISALDEQSLRRGLQREDTEAPGADDIRAQNKRFEDMTSRGITVRGHENFHAKFVVVDDRMALVSSANLETAALMDGKSRAVTGENGFLVSDKDEVGRLARYFTRLWHDCTYQMPPGKDHTVQERSPSPASCRVPMAGIDQSTGVIWTYTDELGIRDAIHDIIGRARRSLVLATFSLNGIVDHPDLLLAPLERTVRAHRPEVRLLVRARNNHIETRRGAAALADLGVDIRADSLTHAKAAIADDTYGALFSANFDAQHGLLSGAEVGVRLDGHPALDEAARHLRHAMSNTDLRFVSNPTQLEMDTRLGARWRSPWPFDRDLRVTATDVVWRPFAAAARSGPVLYSRSGVGITLYAGADTWHISTDNGGQRTLTHTGRSGHEGTVRQLLTWIDPSARRPAGQCGFCPAVVSRQR